MAVEYSAEIMDALNFDPFKDNSSEGGQQGQDNQFQRREPVDELNSEAGRPPEGGAGQSAQRQAPPVAGQSTQPGGQQQPPANSVQAFMDSIHGGNAPPITTQPAQQVPVQQQPQGGGQQQGQGEGRQERQQFDYSGQYTPKNMNVPKQYYDAIFGENREHAEQALGSLVGAIYNSLAQEMHDRLASMHGQMSDLPGQIISFQQVRQQQQELQTKFYGTHKDLDNPRGKDTVLMIAQNTVKMYQDKGMQIDVMSDDFQNYVADSARKLLGSAIPQKPNARQQFATGGGSRGGGEAPNPFADALGVSFG